MIKKYNIAFIKLKNVLNIAGKIDICNIDRFLAYILRILLIMNIR